MKKETFISEKKECIVYHDQDPEYLLIQPIEKDHTGTLDHQAEITASGMDHPILFAAFKVENWNREMSPWDAEPVFGNEPFGNEAGESLVFIEEILIPGLKMRYGLPPKIPVILGGYSLAALFSLWCACRTETFAGIAAASPSVWFPGWMEYAETHIPKSSCIYLSLGDKEDRAKNPVMAAVGNCIRAQQALLDRYGVTNILEWNKGNHFVSPDIRTAKGFRWCMNSIGAGSRS